MAQVNNPKVTAERRIAKMCDKKSTSLSSHKLGLDVVPQPLNQINWIV